MGNDFAKRLSNLVFMTDFLVSLVVLGGYEDTMEFEREENVVVVKKIFATNAAGLQREC